VFWLIKLVITRNIERCVICGHFLFYCFTKTLVAFFSFPNRTSGWGWVAYVMCLCNKSEGAKPYGYIYRRLCTVRNGQLKLHKIHHSIPNKKFALHLLFHFKIDLDIKLWCCDYKLGTLANYVMIFQSWNLQEITNLTAKLCNCDQYRAKVQRNVYNR
jgi:hypothetical protein